jgi:hypothetical protein
LDGRIFVFLKRGDDILDLNKLIAADSGWRLVGASAINDRGQILALGSKNGEVHPVLVSPPSPPRAVAARPAVVSNPDIGSTVRTQFSIVSFERLNDGSFRMAFNAQPGASYRIEASTNLTSWSAVGEAVSRNGQLEFVDKDAPKFELRFYRVARP